MTAGGRANPHKFLTAGCRAVSGWFWQEMLPKPLQKGFSSDFEDIIPAGFHGDS
jgi:hypothetical protein